MYGLETIKAMNEERGRKEFRMSAINLSTDVYGAASAQARVALKSLDRWLADAERKLVGRQVVRTNGLDVLYGSIAKIVHVTVAAGASGHHLFLTAPVVQVERDFLAYPGDRKEIDPRMHERLKSSHRLLELGVNCELIAEDDVPDMPS